SSRRRHTRFSRDWSSDVCSSDLWRTVLIFSSCVCVTSSVGLASQGWHAPSVPAWLGLFGLGVSGLVGQLAMTRAFGYGSTLLTRSEERRVGRECGSGWGVRDGRE